MFFVYLILSLLGKAELKMPPLPNYWQRELEYQKFKQLCLKTKL